MEGHTGHQSCKSYSIIHFYIVLALWCVHIVSSTGPHAKVHAISLLCAHPQPSVRRTHNTGRKHRDEVRRYYEMWFEAQTGMKTVGKYGWLCVRILYACMYVHTYHVLSKNLSL